MARKNRSISEGLPGELPWHKIKVPPDGELPRVADEPPVVGEMSSGSWPKPPGELSPNPPVTVAGSRPAEVSSEPPVVAAGEPPVEVVGGRPAEVVGEVLTEAEPPIETEALAKFEDLGDCLPADKNPYLVYVGGLDKASRGTMASAARVATCVLTGLKLADVNPASFPWHRLSYGVVKRVRSILQEDGWSKDEKDKDKKALAPTTINKVLTFMRLVMEEAWSLGIISHEEYKRVAKVENLKSDHLAAGGYIERDEVARLFLACHGVTSAGKVPETLLGLRDAALLSLMVGAGLRENEATLMNRGDYDPDKGIVKVLHGKGHKQREAYLETAFEAPLKRLLKAIEGGVEDPLIPRFSPRSTLIRPLKKISIQAVHSILEGRAIEGDVVQIGKDGQPEAKCTPHDLRRTFITHQLDLGVDPLRLAKVVGHSSPKTTMIYDRRTAESNRRAIRGEDGASAEDVADRARREEIFLAAMKLISEE